MEPDRPLSPLTWHRGPRSQFNLDHDHGLYALFLRNGAELKGITPGEEGLLYIGLAANRKGLKGRCHFNASTRNHSPRKSLAVLLMEKLTLEPVLVVKPASRNTWSLAPASEQRLTAWMLENLELAPYHCSYPEPLETELIGRFAPPLNLSYSPRRVRGLAGVA
ncbi:MULTISPECIES: GIY-YIG nuclease family protein [unclassified Sphingomonas]|uniref:GIY-YIG nuclease family protein n=1 Tax=Novosphingobium rhizosphaerae TaxID=1551649 RepID=UPI0015CBBBE3